jgi:opacity protein-like surface antigen
MGGDIRGRLVDFVQRPGAVAYNAVTSEVATRGTRKTFIWAATLGVILALASVEAEAQNCDVPSQLKTDSAGGGHTIGNLSVASAGLGATIGSALTTANTAFLTQSDAFIGSPANPPPGSPGGGLWVRGVGGETTVKSLSTTGATYNQPPLGGVSPGASGSIPCTAKIHETYSGVQLGMDVARFNVNDMNFHLGATAGYLESNSHVDGGNILGGPFTATVQNPFIGVYGAVTKGGFFAQGTVRWQDFQGSFNSPSINLFNQNVNAHGWTVSGSTGYQYKIANSDWFIEPSAGFILARTEVDPFNPIGPTQTVQAGALAGNTFQTPGILTINPIDSAIGRLGVRVGTTVSSGNIVWQPFLSVSVWNEFAKGASSSYQTCQACIGLAAPGVFVPGVISSVSTSNTIGTFGQYSAGFSAQIADTGWLGFARVDFRDGSNLQGLSGTGGIRYQFTPEAAKSVPVVYRKAPAYERIAGPYNWTGIYLGGFAGAVYGNGHVGLPPEGAVAPHVAGFLGGGQVGYNYQIGAWVLGVEGDGGWTNTKGSTACAPGGGNTIVNGAGVTAPLFNLTCNAQADWITTLTGRFGYAQERNLYYIKGGAAWSNESSSTTCNFGPLVPNPAFANQFCTNPSGVRATDGSASALRPGWTIGLGLEFGLTANWSAKAEYDYVSFGNRNLAASNGNVINTGMGVSEVKIGLNYRFNTPTLAAKY